MKKPVDIPVVGIKIAVPIQQINVKKEPAMIYLLTAVICLIILAVTWMFAASLIQAEGELGGPGPTEPTPDSGLSENRG